MTKRIKLFRCPTGDKEHRTDSSHFYRPQTKCAKVMFLHLSVSHSVNWGGVCIGGGLCIQKRSASRRVCIKGAGGKRAGGTHATGMDSWFIFCSQY